MHRVHLILSQTLSKDGGKPKEHVKKWRSEAILTFDYEWINDELFVKDNFITEFQGKLIREADL